MKKTLKELKWNMIIPAVLSIILGVILIIFPDTSMRFIVNIIAIGMLIAGVADIVRYFTFDLRVSLYRNDFLYGVIMLSLGLLFILNPSIIISLIPFILAIYLLISGFIKLQDGIDAYRMKYDKSTIYIILALVSIVFGLVIMFNLIEAASMLFIFIGIGLIYTGISDIYTAVYLSSKLEKFYNDNLL